MLNLEPIRILLVDDQPIVHQALSEMISFIDDFELVGQAYDGRESIDLCKTHKPHIVLMDVMMPLMGGIEATKQILQIHSQIKVLALSSYQDDDSVYTMLNAGASGYILKNTSVDDLESIIRTVHEGNTVISSDLMQNLLLASTRKPSQQDFNLSPREHEILKLIGRGMSYAQIADHLVISISTVKFHIGNLLSKLGVETRNEAIAIAAKNDLI